MLKRMSGTQVISNIPYNQKSTGVRSSERSGHEVLQTRPNTLSSPQIVNGNHFIGLIKNRGAPLCMQLITDNTLI
ncbi:hypothetical protein TNCV_2529131 [Trichonephila clavipes]|nr:hypothetical protein TNCV_2529131 [Trichonephila clavipes]